MISSYMACFTIFVMAFLQINEITPYLDGGLFYGVTKAWADALRSYTNGTLACSDSTCRYPARNTVGLPMANPPPPADHVLKSAQRFYSRSLFFLHAVLC